MRIRHCCCIGDPSRHCRRRCLQSERRWMPVKLSSIKSFRSVYFFLTLTAMIYAIVAKVVIPAEISRKKRAPLICFSCVKASMSVAQPRGPGAVTNMTTSIEPEDSPERSSSNLPIQIVNDDFDTHLERQKKIKTMLWGPRAGRQEVARSTSLEPDSCWQ